MFRCETNPQLSPTIGTLGHPNPGFISSLPTSPETDCRASSRSSTLGFTKFADEGFNEAIDGLVFTYHRMKNPMRSHDIMTKSHIESHQVELKPMSSPINHHEIRFSPHEGPTIF